MKKTLIALSLLLLAYQPTSASELWSSSAILPDNLSGLFYSGNKFIGYRLTPTLRIYYSTNGAEWTSYDTSISPLSVGHDGQGRIYALTRTMEESYISGYYNYTAHLWTSDDAQSWHSLGDLAHYWEIIPQSASFIAGNGRFLIKLHNQWGAGTSTGSPPHPLFSSSMLNPTNFVVVPEGNSLDSLRYDGSHFFATKSSSTQNMIMESTDGMQWDLLFPLGLSYPPDQLVAVWDSLFFILKYFPGLTVQSKISGSTPFNSPDGFSPYTNPLSDMFCNERSLVIRGENKVYVSMDFSETWDVFQPNNLCGLAYNGDTYILGSHAGTNTVLYRFTPSPSQSITPSNTDLQIRFGQGETVDSFWNPPTTNYYQATILDVNTTNTFIQVECSIDLKTWQKHGLPTTNNPVFINISTMGSDSMFFRVGDL